VYNLTYSAAQHYETRKRPRIRFTAAEPAWLGKRMSLYLCELRAEARGIRRPRGINATRRNLRATPQAGVCLPRRRTGLLSCFHQVDEHSQAIARLKTIWSCVVAGIRFLAAAPEDSLFGSR